MKWSVIPVRDGKCEFSVSRPEAWSESVSTANPSSRYQTLTGSVCTEACLSVRADVVNSVTCQLTCAIVQAILTTLWATRFTTGFLPCAEPTGVTVVIVYM